MDAIDSVRQIKFSVSNEAHDQIRLAAALRRTTMAGFCRDVVLSEAAKVTQTVSVPPQPTSEGRRKK